MVTSIKGNDTSTFGGNVDVTGNVITDAPCFSAWKSSDTEISHNVFTKVTFDTEDFDTSSDYDTSNGRFTPSVAGYYQLSAFLHQEVDGANKVAYGYFYKNGNPYQILSLERASTDTNTSNTGSVLVYANGTTDYFEVYTIQTSGVDTTLYGQQKLTRFAGFLARAV